MHYEFGIEGENRVRPTFMQSPSMSTEMKVLHSWEVIIFSTGPSKDQ